MSRARDNLYNDTQTWQQCVNARCDHCNNTYTHIILKYLYIIYVRYIYIFIQKIYSTRTYMRTRTCSGPISLISGIIRQTIISLYVLLKNVPLFCFLFHSRPNRVQYARNPPVRPVCHGEKRRLQSDCHYRYTEYR